MAVKTRFAAVGDIFLGRRMTPNLAAHGAGMFLERVRPVLAEFDLVLGNLEAVVSDRHHSMSGPTGLAMASAHLTALHDANIRAVALANNHTMDYGFEGLKGTLSTLDSARISHVGAGLEAAAARNPLIVESPSRIGILAYFGSAKEQKSGGVNAAAQNDICTDIEALRGRTDAVVVALHWGRLDQRVPMQHQVRTAHALIDAGATVIVASGPHTLMPVERYGAGVIAYSLGNFLFDAVPVHRRQSCIMAAELGYHEVSEIRLIPVASGEDFIPRPLPEDEGGLYARTSSLLVTRLAEVDSDAGIARKILHRGLTDPIGLFKRLMFGQRAAEPLRFYVRSLVHLVREKLRFRSDR